MVKNADKPKLVLNEDTMTLVNLEGYRVINKQHGDIGKGQKGYRVTAHFSGSLAVLAAYSEEEHADECLKALIHYTLTGEDTINKGDKDVFKVRSIIKESLIVMPDEKNANNVVGIKK